MLSSLAPCTLERWYSRYGFRATYNLSSAAAPSLTTADLLGLAGPENTEAYIRLGLNYCPPQGTLRLREAVSGQYTTLRPDDVQVTTGASEAIFLLLNALISPGDAVIVQFPIYPAIDALARALGADVRQWLLLPNGQADLNHLAALLNQSNVRAIMLNHPHGPTGALMSAEELRTIATFAADHGAILVADEVYRGIQFGGSASPAAADLGAHAVSIGDMAKPYGLGGLRVGWIATANRPLLKRCAELRDYTSLCGSAPGEYLAAVALEHRAVILNQHLAVARQNRALFAKAMAEVRWLDWRLPDGGFTIFPRSTLVQTTVAICHELCEAYDVLVLPGEVFAMPHHLRVGFGVSPSEFEDGLVRLLAFAEIAVRRGRRRSAA